jgi:hypothetical protein
MGIRRSLVPALSVPLIAVVLAVALVSPAFNYSYVSPQTFTYHVAIQRGTNTMLTITNNTILLTIAYGENYGSASGTLAKDLFIASGGRVYVSFVPTFCEVRPTPIPLDIAMPPVLTESAIHQSALGAPQIIIVPPPPPPPPPPPHWHLLPVQKPAGLIDLYISFIPVTPTSGPVNVTVQILPCTPFFTTNSSVTLLPGYYDVTVKFVWVLSSEFYALNGTLSINVAHTNVITPLSGSS